MEDNERRIIVAGIYFARSPSQIKSATEFFRGIAHVDRVVIGTKIFEMAVQTHGDRGFERVKEIIATMVPEEDPSAFLREIAVTTKGLANRTLTGLDAAGAAKALGVEEATLDKLDGLLLPHLDGGKKVYWLDGIGLFFEMLGVIDLQFAGLDEQERDAIYSTYRQMAV